MKNENQPISTKNDASLKNKPLTKYIAQFIIPFYLGITTPVLNTSCGTKGKLQGLEQTINGQKEANTTQDTAIGGLKTDVTNIQSKLTNIEDANKTQLEKQNRTDTTQNEKIDAISKTNEEKKAEIEQLRAAIKLLQYPTQTDQENQDGEESSETSDPIDENSTDTNLDLELENSILQLLKTCQSVFPHLTTIYEVLSEAEKNRKNVAKKILEEGIATTTTRTKGEKVNETVTSVTKGRATTLTIPKGKTFNLQDMIREISSNAGTDKIDDLIKKQKEKINKLEANQTSSEQDRDTSERGTETAVVDKNAKDDGRIRNVPINEYKHPAKSISPTNSEKTSDKTNTSQKCIKSKEYTSTSSVTETELTPLIMEQTGIDKYQIYELNLDNVPRNKNYAYVVYGVRGIISIDNQKIDSFRNDFAVIEVQKSSAKYEIRLSDGIIYLFDVTETKNKYKLNQFIQSKINETCDFNDWPQRQADQIIRITPNSKKTARK